MNKQPLAAFTIALGEKAKQQASVAFSTFKKHHSEIPIFLVDESNYRFFAGSVTPSHLGELVSIRVLVGWFLSLHFERVIHLDADVIVFGTLDRLLHFEKPAVMTNDLSTYTMRNPDLPRINAGVLAAQTTDFWIEWTRVVYSTLLPLNTTNFFDQFALRCLVKQQPENFEIIDEKGSHLFYNVSVREQQGEWRFKDNQFFKGDSEIRLYHRAGERELQSTLPTALQNFIEKEMAENHLEALQADWSLFSSTHWESFKTAVSDLLSSLPFLLEERFKELYQESKNLYRTDMPLFWDRLRPVEKSGFARTLQKNPPAFIYSKVL